MWKPLVIGCLLIGIALPAWAQDPQPPAQETAAEQNQNYPRPELLIDVAELAGALQRDPAASRFRHDAQEIVLLDARPQEEYRRGHLAGALGVDVDEWKKAFGEGTDQLGWAKRIGDLGIDGKLSVVVYDEALTGNAARVWWILRYWGVEKVSLLNGGMKAWHAESYPTLTATFTAEPKPFEPRARGDRLVTHKELVKILSDGDPFKLFDTRTANEHQEGKIATCTHLDWQDLVDQETGKMLPVAELKKLLEEAGFDSERPTVTYCQSGGRASVMAFALELMGGKQVANYYGSWQEWSRLEMPKSVDN